MTYCSQELANVCYAVSVLFIIAMCSAAPVAMMNPITAYMCVVFLFISACFIVLGRCLRKRSKAAFRLLVGIVIGLTISPLVACVTGFLSGSSTAFRFAGLFAPMSAFSIAVLMRIRTKECYDEFS